MAYIGLFVQFSFLPDGLDENDIRDDTAAVLGKYSQFANTSIEVTIEEHAGVICHDKYMSHEDKSKR